MSQSEDTPRAAADAAILDRPADAYLAVRRATERLVSPLSEEDSVVQSMPDASPAKWHLAHTTWFFETFVLERTQPGFRPFDPAFRILFNSYYNTVGPQHARPRRGLLTRPSRDQVRAYRAHVDGAITRLVEQGTLDDRARRVFGIGLNHEQQHQELILMDIKHLLSCNPIRPAYAPPATTATPAAAPRAWIPHDGGLVTIGAGPDGFAFDNERPRHEVLTRDFEIASRLVTNSEYLEFMDDGGYDRPDLWLSDGWDTVRREGWVAPLYWTLRDGRWHEFTLRGEHPVVPTAPVAHISYYEADAFARWAGARLPTEAEWERVAAGLRIEGNFLESDRLHPAPAPGGGTGPRQVFGDLWEWTASPYAPYPGYRPPEGALGEYNGKFMVNQMVLRGGCCATPQSHIRATYRNFFYPHQRWAFTGLRIARDAS